jgi:hypothetical protein
MQFAGRELLQIRHDPRQIPGVRRDDRVEMILHDDPRMDTQALLPPAIVERPGEDVAAGRAVEDRKPVHDRGGDEMGSL